MIKLPSGTEPKRRTHAPRSGALALALLAATGCVSSAKYDDAMAKIDGDAAKIRVLDARIEGCKKDLTETLARANQHDRELSAALDQENALSQELRKRLEELGQDASKLMIDKGALAVSLEVQKARIAALRRAQAASEARAALYRDVAHKLQKMIDAGQLSVRVRDGRMVIALPTDVLFDSGQVDIKPAAREGLKQLAGVLKTIEGRHFQVAGHTDTVPISTTRFPSNWELSNGRALEVTRFLIGQGLRPEALSAAGYSEYDPVGSNDSAQGRQQNRRIEITLVPSIDEMVAVPE